MIEAPVPIAQAPIELVRCYSLARARQHHRVAAGCGRYCLSQPHQPSPDALTAGGVPGDQRDDLCPPAVAFEAWSHTHRQYAFDLVSGAGHENVAGRVVRPQLEPITKVSGLLVSQLAERVGHRIRIVNRRRSNHEIHALIVSALVGNRMRWRRLHGPNHPRGLATETVPSAATTDTATARPPDSHPL